MLLPRILPPLIRRGIVTTRERRHFSVIEMRSYKRRTYYLFGQLPVFTRKL